MTDTIADLRERMRRARETAVIVDGHAFTLLRPSQIESMRLVRKRTDDESQLAHEEEKVIADIELTLPYIIGWGLTVGDLLGEDDATPAPFDATLLRDFLEQNLELAVALVAELFALMGARHEEQDAEKKP